MFVFNKNTSGGNTAALSNYAFPSTKLLKHKEPKGFDIESNIRKIGSTIVDFYRADGINIYPVGVDIGDRVLKFAFKSERGTPVVSILERDLGLKINLDTQKIRFEAPIPGTSAIGIEVPREVCDTVYLNELIESPDFVYSGSKLSACIGRDVGGNNVIIDLDKMDNLLIAGKPGSGKSTLIADIITGILYKAKPNEVKMVLIDTEENQFWNYRKLPHLYTPVINKRSAAMEAIMLLNSEAKRRCPSARKNSSNYDSSDRDSRGTNEPIVVVIENFEYLISEYGEPLETLIAETAKIGRSVGIHFIISTSSTDGDVITDKIKESYRSRICLSVDTPSESTQVLAFTGGESLMGEGDLLLSWPNAVRPTRIQAAYISTAEQKKVISAVTKQATDYNFPVYDYVNDKDKKKESAPKEDYTQTLVTAAKALAGQFTVSLGYIAKAAGTTKAKAKQYAIDLLSYGIIGKTKNKDCYDVYMTPAGIDNAIKKIENDKKEIDSMEEKPKNNEKQPENYEFISWNSLFADDDTIDDNEDVIKDTSSACEPHTEDDSDIEYDEFPDYKFPTTDLLSSYGKSTDDYSEETDAMAEKLISTFEKLNIDAKIRHIDHGPTVTRFEIVPEKGVKVSKILNLESDIALHMDAVSIRIEAPIPGKSAIGIEIPNETREMVSIKEVMESDEFRSNASCTAFCVGKDIEGNPVIQDIVKLPHLVVSGATGMGKSVFINNIIMSILYKASPNEVKLILIDPKGVEFNKYYGIPHLSAPIVQSDDAIAALMFAHDEMNRRYDKLTANDASNIDQYNGKVRRGEIRGKTMPKIVIIIDEIADLMIANKSETETLIGLLAQKSRAAGIHMIIGTQRPSNSILSKFIMANIPSRACFKTASYIDSKVVLDAKGAEKLLPRGDMLFFSASVCRLTRIQCAFANDNDIDRTLEFVKAQCHGSYHDDRLLDKIEKERRAKNSSCQTLTEDETFAEAVELAISQRQISTALLQRKLSIGFGKAAIYIDRMEELGIVGPKMGSKPRSVLLTQSEWDEKMNRN